MIDYDALLAIYERNRRGEERLMKLMEELAAGIARHLQEKLRRESNSISTEPVSKEMSYDHQHAATSLVNEEEDTQEPNSPAMSLPMEEEVQEDHEPATFMEEEEDEANSRPSMENNKAQEVQTQSALATVDEPNLQQAQLNLRANSFQEREIDAGARGPICKPNEVQTKTSNMGDLRPKYKPMIKNTYTSNNNLGKLRYQEPP